MFRESSPNFFPDTVAVQSGSLIWSAPGSRAIESRYCCTIAFTALSTSSTCDFPRRVASSFGGTGSGRTQRRPSPSAGPIRLAGPRPTEVVSTGSLAMMGGSSGRAAVSVGTGFTGGDDARRVPRPCSTSGM